ncbi:hypothetical protein CYLTODRAFT_441943 [Cylindrobasidium torrendii FP15055 ss-10]|uniref:Uncharacterized protein n=1 Tax=Cylindrobasidium torrendii FP15055 ss-10 TaxID=1314674 RepID=A0A0D7BLK6_9AGAR|nr:hypothetical protein CYLTODRAFT_441943 [Cylindrobasidium torrendii FP15055 ss-10]
MSTQVSVHANQPVSGPTDEELIVELQTYAIYPGRSKLRAALKSRKNWVISDVRLKRVLDLVPPCREPDGLLHELFNAQMPALNPDGFAKTPQAIAFSGVGTPFEYPIEPQVLKPRLPLAPYTTQILYRELSGSQDLLLFGRGSFDYAVKPNDDLLLFVEVYRQRLEKILHPQDWPFSQFVHRMKRSSPIQLLFDYYEAAGKIAGLPYQDVVRQFQAEWGFNPLECLTDKESHPDYRLMHALHKEEVHKTQFMRMRANEWRWSPEKRDSIPLDGEGRPVYDLRKDSRFSMTITKLDRRAGMPIGELKNVVVYPTPEGDVILERD